MPELKQVWTEETGLWSVGDWFRLPNTHLMDGSTFTGEVEKIITNGWGDTSIFFYNGCFPVRYLAWAVRL